MFGNQKACVIATTSNTCLNHFVVPTFFLPKVQIMKYQRRTPQCCTLVKIPNVLTHMYYIFINKNLYINTIKEKNKCALSLTTPTTPLKAAPVKTYLSYPRSLTMVTTWLRQPTTFFILCLYFLHFIDSMHFTFCRMS